MPIHRLLGTCRDRIPAYASSAYLATPEDYADEALGFRSKGWTAYKIHPHTVPKEDIEICQVMRNAVGKDMVLMLDSMWSYTYEDALRVGRAIEALDYLWYEDPLAEDDIYNYVKLKSKLDIPILSTEWAPGRFYGMAQWIQQGATDMLRGTMNHNRNVPDLPMHLRIGINAGELIAEDDGLSVRQAAYVHALRRLGEAIEAHGHREYFRDED